MKYVVFYPANSESRMVAGARIARWLDWNLPYPQDDVVLCDGRNVPQFEEDYTLFWINVPKTMVQNVPASEQLVERAKKFIWIQNDYSINTPSPYTKDSSMMNRAFTKRVQSNMHLEGWSTCMDRVERFPGVYHYINWNALAYSSLPPGAGSVNCCSDDILYFGSFRKDRIKSFDKYMYHPSIVVSAPARAQAKFKERYPGVRTTDILQIPDGLCGYTKTIYMEDEFSHKRYHSPANRFYEALSANLAILVDEAAVGTLRKTGFDVPKFCVVSRQTDLDKADFPLIQEFQTSYWRMDPELLLPHNEALKVRLEQLCGRL